MTEKDLARPSNSQLASAFIGLLVVSGLLAIVVMLVSMAIIFVKYAISL